MSKTLELHGVYETYGGEWTAEVACIDLGTERNCCLFIYTNKNDGLKKSGIGYLDGSTSNSYFDLIIPDPEPKWRPWKVEEIPVGSRVRRKDNRAYETLILKNSAAIAGDEPYLIFLDGTSWQPCGVLE